MTFAHRYAARVAAGAGLVVLAAATASGQGAEAAATHPGALTMRGEEQLGMVIAAPAPRRAALTAANAIVALLRADAALAKPVGYGVVLTPVAGMTKLVGTERPATSRPVYGVRGALNYFAMEDDGHGGRRVGDGGGSVPFSVVVNAAGRLTDAEEIDPQPDHGPAVLSDIRQTGEFRGHPIYNGECIVVSGGTAPPFVPMTVERYYRIMILAYRGDSVRHAAQHRSAAATGDSEAIAAEAPAAKAKRHKDMMDTYEVLKKGDPKGAEDYLAAAKAAEDQIEARAYHTGPGVHDDSAMNAAMNSGAAASGQLIAGYQAKLDALSPAERQAPAAVAMHEYKWNYKGDQFADVNDPDSAPLVQLNPAFFDQRKSATAPQVITVCIPGIQGLENKAYESQAGDERESQRRMLEQRTRDAVRVRDHLDWAALEAMVKQ